MAIYSRLVEHRVNDALSDTRVVLIVGPRQSGKTTLAKKTAKAVTATARKSAVLFYNTLRHGMEYSDPGASHYEENYRRRVLTNLERRAKSFGYTLQPAPTSG
ncbi:AAA family ATPase [Pararhizobium sp. A13]|uniref:AAA family ATPase n=1 Tax=Pararhizobium sp. A13 TaxID=3133975 RepID=UPI00311B0C50